MKCWFCNCCASRRETPDNILIAICGACQESMAIEVNPPKKEYIVERKVRE